MRFSVIILALAFTIFAAAQSPTTTTTAAPEPTDPTSICLKACSKGDVNCQAKCVGVPSPDNSMANATNECVAKCVDDNKSIDDPKPYYDCVEGCINNKFLVSSGAATGAATPTTTGTAAATESGSARSAPTGSGASGSGSGTSGTRTGASASASSTGAASAGYAVTGPFIGLFAMAAGLIVL